jgi:hypothetical protein
MRCKVIVVLSVFIDVYFTPFLCAWFLSNLYARAYEGDV